MTLSVYFTYCNMWDFRVCMGISGSVCDCVRVSGGLCVRMSKCILMCAFIQFRYPLGQ